MTNSNASPATQSDNTPSFAAMDLPAPLLRALERIGFTTPTPIQAMAIPRALLGKDILGTAQTGTGKTAAFVIPMIAYLTENTSSVAIIMTPTRELAQQVSQMIQPLLDRSIADGIRSAILIGGASMVKQLDMLKRKPRVIIGTPGRINDHLERRSLNLSKAHFLVLDETDRMLDMGFGKQIDRVLSYMPAQRQTLLFSATLPPEIVKLSERYLRKPERIAAGEVSRPAAKVKQESRTVSQGDKYRALLEELEARTGSVIIFVRTKHGADKLAHKLEKDGHTASPIHGNLRQNQRTKAIAAFRAGDSRVLVATDVAARGLDIPHVAHVINHDLPQVPEDYVHRIGRTGRAGAEGEAMSFVSPEERGLWRDIQRLLNPGDVSEQRSPDENRGEGRRRATANPPRNQYAKKKRFNDGPRNFRPREDRRDNNGGQTNEDRPRRTRPDGDFKPRRARPEGESRFKRDDRDGPRKDTRRDEGKGWKMDRDRQDRPRGDRPDREDRPRRARPDGDFKPRRDRPEGESRFKRDDRPRSDFKPRGDSFKSRDRDDKPRSDSFKRRDRDDKPRGDFKPRERDDRPHSSKPPQGGKKPHRKGRGGFGGHAHSAAKAARRDRD